MVLVRHIKVFTAGRQEFGCSTWNELSGEKADSAYMASKEGNSAFDLKPSNLQKHSMYIETALKSRHFSHEGHDF